MKIENNWLVESKSKKINHSPTKQKGGRIKDSSISLIVIHSIGLPAGKKGYGSDCVRKLFMGELDAEPVSAHVFIRRDGHIIQFVPFNYRAWHAGESSYKGREVCNAFSIGIELEGAEEDHSGYEDIQYKRLAKLCVRLRRQFPHIKDNIVGHKDIALHKEGKCAGRLGRKSDPWHFNWIKFCMEMRKTR